MDISVIYITWMFPKIGVYGPPKMDGENNGSKAYFQMDDLGGKPIIFGNTHISWLVNLPPPLTSPPQK